MKKILLLIAFIAFALVSCEKEGPVQPVEIHDLKLTLPEGMSWQNGDVVSAGVNNLSTPLNGVSGNTRTAEFTFKKALNEGTIVRFPGVANPSTLSIPAEQTSVGGETDSDAVHFYGSVKMSDEPVPTVELSSVMSTLKFAIKGDATLVHATLETMAGEPLNGVFSLSRQGSLTTVKNNESTTKVMFETPLQLSENEIVDLYIPVPAASYSKGFMLKLYDNADNYMMVLIYDNGGQLATGSVTEFKIIYAGGFMTILNPGEDFGSGTLTEQDAGPMFGEFSAQGKIVYDDGQPAVGVKVSDGFNVVQTDEKGKYAFKAAGHDVRYIYISYPSDARVTVSRDGCPEFFQKFEAGKYIYDFTLIRQPVENEFAIFAMADPQTHYKARDTQKSADTDRYGAETVPAINAELAKQTLPCYGISLGDITYSEDSRDSTPSMEIIRSHFSRINMPIFNVMGNHDYTYYKTNASVSTSVESSTINLLSQRSYEKVFGPVNFSFDRGNVHFVCMKDIYFESTTNWDAGNYDGGFTDAEYEWLVQDLEKTPKTMKVVLCVHIPISTSSGPNISKVKNLLKSFTNSIVFSGHTHYQRTVYEGNRLYEQIHAAVCGQWWWSRIEGDGCPNGYTIHYFKDTDITDAYFIGVNEGMNTRDYQMRLYKANLRTGGKYAYFQQSHGENEYLINIFNGDEKWKIKVYENGVYAGQPTWIPTSKYTLTAGKNGQTHTIPSTSSQDWWAIGYHIGYCNRGASGSSYQTNNFHMWKWTAIDPTAKIKVEAEDPYGNVYTCEDVVTDGTNYPDYIKTPLKIF